MEKMQRTCMVNVEGGGERAWAACGAMVALNLCLIPMTRLGALWMASKTIGVCSIVAAVS